MNANINCLTQTKSWSLAALYDPGKFQPRVGKQMPQRAVIGWVLHGRPTRHLIRLIPMTGEPALGTRKP
jgi:hypothetical protein